MEGDALARAHGGKKRDGARYKRQLEIALPICTRCHSAPPQAGRHAAHCFMALGAPTALTLAERDCSLRIPKPWDYSRCVWKSSRTYPDFSAIATRSIPRLRFRTHLLKICTCGSQPIGYHEGRNKTF